MDVLDCAGATDTLLQLSGNSYWFCDASPDLFVMADSGLFRSTDRGVTWTRSYDTLPIGIHSARLARFMDGWLFAGVPGMGVWRLNISGHDDGSPTPTPPPSFTSSLQGDPASTSFQLTVSCHDPGTVSVRAYDIDGRLQADIAEQSFSAGDHVLKVDVSRWPPGRYQIVARAGSNLSSNGLIVVHDR
ncbi:MAG: hypothetical protein JSS75_09605 [Bacteroidetes bacterium]|nr:hypothetical protein [Bacteroidota bacterium]